MKYSRKGPFAILAGLGLALSSCLGFFLVSGTAPSAATTGMTWTAPEVVDHVPTVTSPYFVSGYMMIGLSCPAANVCVGVNSNGEVDTSTNPTGGPSAWTLTAIDSVAIRSISCPTTSFCAASDSAGNTFTSANPLGGPLAWTKTNIDGTTNLNSVSCVSSSSCVAIDSSGNYSFYNGASWTPPAATGASSLAGVSCAPGTAFCLAVGSTAAFVDNSGTWAPTSATGESTYIFDAVSCESSTMCVAVDSGGGVDLYNGSTWALSPGVDGTNVINAITCPSGCVAVDSAGNVLAARHPLGGAPAWTVTPSGAPELSSVSCALGGVSLCIAGDAYGNVFTTPGPTPPSYSPPSPAMPPVHIHAISCVSSSFCAAITSAGQAVIFNGSTWTVPSILSLTPLYAVSCASPTFCVAVNSTNAYLFNGSIWETATSTPALPWTNPIDATPSIGSVSCVSASYCIAVDGSGNYLTYTGGSTWSTAASGAPSLTELSCVSASFCMAVGGASAYGFNGVNWTTLTGTWVNPIDGSASLSSISCSSISFCVADDNAGNVLDFNGSTWSAPTNVDGTTIMNPVSCPTATFCAVGDLAGNFLTFNGSTWSTPTAISATMPVYGLSCTSSTFCMAGGFTGALFAYSGSATWTQSGFVDNPVRAISCASSTFCIATDMTGDVNTYTGSWSGPTNLDATYPINAISCASPTFCVAVDARGYYMLWTGSWAAPTATGDAHPLYSISCPTTTFCAAGDNLGYWISFNGSTWTAPVAINTVQTLTSISCPTATFCVAVDNAGFELTYNGSTWTAPVMIDSGSITINSVSCPATNFCEAVDANGYVMHYNGTSWSAPSQLSTSPLQSVSCTSISFCALTDGSRIIDWDGGGWNAPVSAPTGMFLFALSCTGAPPTLCVAGGGHGQATLSTNPAGNPAVWTSTPADGTNPIESASCPSSSLCVLGDGHGNILSGTSPSAPTPTSGTEVHLDGTNKITSMSCESSTMCVAGDNAGNIFYSTNPSSGTVTSWTQANLDGTNFINAISCPSASLCVAGDSVGNVLVSTSPATLTGASWVAYSVDPGFSITSISCPSSPSTTVCVAVDNYGNVVTSTNPTGGATAWTVTSVAPAFSFNGVSCASANLCVAVVGTTSSNAYVSTNPLGGVSAWTPVTITTGSPVPTAISCPSTTFCAAVDSSGDTITSMNPTGGATAWNRQNVDFSQVLTSISCSSAYLCDAFDNSGDAIAGIVPTPPPPPPTTTYTLTLTPSTSTLNPGAQVTISASLTETSTNSSTGAVTTTPISGTSVSFDVSSGPDAGLTFSGTTNSSGIATYVFTNKGGSGVDTVTAGTTPTGTTTPVVASATVTFTGLSSLTLSPASQGAVVGQSVSVSGLALDPSGAPLVGASVIFSVSTGPDQGISSTLTTNTKGVANFTLASPKAGIDQISATLSNSATPSTPSSSSSVSSNQVTVTWAAPISIVTQGPSSTTPVIVGSPVTLSVTLTSPASALIKTHLSEAKSLEVAYDLFHLSPLTNVADSGITVNFSVVSGPNHPKSGTAITNAAGTASWSYTDTGGPGTDSVTGSFVDSAGIAHSTSFSVVWVATTTTTTSTTLATTTTLAPTTTVSPTTQPPSSGPPPPPPSNSPPPPPAPILSSNSSPTTSLAPSSSTTSLAPTTTTTLAKNLVNKSHLSKGTSTSSSIQALGLPQPVSSISNGNLVPPQDVKALVAQGQRGPAMHYTQGYGLGKDGGPPGVVPLANSVPSPTEAFKLLSGKTAGQNAAIALLLILLVALPATLFNSTLKEHHKTIASSRGLLRRFVDKVEGWLEGLHTGALLVLFAIVGSILYALVDPTFGFNISSAAEIAGYVGAILVITTTTEIARGVYVHRRFKKIGDLKAFPLGVAIAIVLVVFSRLSHFEPGYVFGVFAAIVFRIEPTNEEDGRSVTWASLWLIGVSALCWIAWIPIKNSVISGHTSFGLLALDSLLSTVWVCGLQSLLFGLIPMKYLDGNTIYHWSKAAWAGLYIVVMFIFVQFVMHPSAAGFGGNKNANMLSMLYLFIGFTVFAGAFWAYFRIKHGKSSDEELHSGHDGGEAGGEAGGEGKDLATTS